MVVRGFATSIAVLAFATLVNAQAPHFPPIRVNAQIFEHPTSAHFVLTRPDGSRLETDAGLQPVHLFDWWRGPGVYGVVARVHGRDVRSSFRVYDTETLVGLTLYDDAAATLHLAPRVAVRDRRVSARLVGTDLQLEIRNDSNDEFEAFGQDGFLHYEVAPATLDPASTQEEREARTGSTFGGCGTGVRPILVPAHTTAVYRLVLPTGATIRPGRYQGSVMLRAPDGHATFVTFEFGLVHPADARFAHELGLEL